MIAPRRRKPVARGANTALLPAHARNDSRANPMVDTRTRTSERGFASMDEEKQREIARKGGRSVPPQARSFAKNPVLASAAGRKGGQSVPPHQRSFSRNP